MHTKEIRRQVIHILYGPILIILFHYGILNLGIIFGMIIGGSLMSFMVKRKRMNCVRWVLSHFERDHHMENFPGRGVLFYTIGAFLALLLFKREVAYASIMILSVGDAITNLVGKHFGRIKTKLNPDKYIEGTLAGILVSIPVAYFFTHNFTAAVVASCVAMFLEMPNVRIFGFEIDDNLLIPLGAGVTLSLFLQMDNKSLGKEGESVARKFLENKGYKIIDTNFHKRTGEIDIIAFDPSFGEYVFVEVKTRRNLSFGYPEEAVDEEKIEKISETAESWFNDKGIDDPEWRIDIIGIEWYGKDPKIDHIQNIS